jgi:hypothetical protein
MSVSHRRRVLRQVLVLEAIAFLVVIAILWLDELWDLPYRIFGAVPRPINVGESVVESLVVLTLGIVIVVITGRAFRRIEYLESLVVLCAWCRRVRDEGEWWTMEEYLARQHHALTSHGICDACASRIEVPPR